MKVVVGGAKTTLYLAPDALRTTSNFFRSALKKEWMEGEENTIKLPEEDPFIFRLYAEWLYTGNIFCKSEATTITRDHETLIDLYIIGEKMLDTVFQDQVIDAILALSKETNLELALHEVSRIYDSTPPGSPMRALVCDKYLISGVNTNTERMAEIGESANREFLFDLLTASLDRCRLTLGMFSDIARRGKPPGCAYHHHAKDEPCKGARILAFPASQKGFWGGGSNSMSEELKSSIVGVLTEPRRSLGEIGCCKKVYWKTR